MHTACDIYLTKVTIGAKRLNQLEGIIIKRVSIGLLILILFIIAGCQDDTDKGSLKESDTANEPEKESKSQEIDGTLWGEDGDVGVVLAHGAAYDADSWEDQGEELAENGIVAFAVEDTSSEELISAANMLKDDYEVNEVSIIGASAGGGAAIDAVNEDAFDFASVVLLSPAGDATEIEEKPVLAVYSEEEGFEELEEARGTIQTLPISGSAHAQEIFENDKKSDKTMKEIISFIKEK